MSIKKIKIKRRSIEYNFPALKKLIIHILRMKLRGLCIFRFILFAYQ